MSSKWKRTPEGLVELFYEVLPDDPRAERRKMFGYPCSFVNGNLWVGLHEDNLLVRLDEASRAELLAVPEARVFEPMAGRQMREYIVVPPSMLEDLDELRKWVDRAFSYGLSLEGKQAKGKGEKKRKEKKVGVGKSGAAAKGAANAGPRRGNAASGRGKGSSPKGRASKGGKGAKTRGRP